MAGNVGSGDQRAGIRLFLRRLGLRNRRLRFLCGGCVLGGADNRFRLQHHILDRSCLDRSCLIRSCLGSNRLSGWCGFLRWFRASDDWRRSGSGLLRRGFFGFGLGRGCCFGRWSCLRLTHHRLQLHLGMHRLLLGGRGRFRSGDAWGRLRCCRWRNCWLNRGDLRLRCGGGYKRHDVRRRHHSAAVGDFLLQLERHRQHSAGICRCRTYGQVVTIRLESAFPVLQALVSDNGQI